MRATEVLQTQHRQIEGILEALEQGKESSALLPELANDLAAHMVVEQNLFYPVVRDADRRMVEESLEEHSIAEIALKRLLKTAPNDAQFAARVSILKELIENHLEREEEELFPRAEETMDTQELEELGAKIEQGFAAAQRKGFEALVPPTMATTSADDALGAGGLEARQPIAEVSTDGGASASR
jgi:hemerythrin superfamily protein